MQRVELAVTMISIFVTSCASRGAAPAQGIDSDGAAPVQGALPPLGPFDPCHEAGLCVYPPPMDIADGAAKADGSDLTVDSAAEAGGAAADTGSTIAASDDAGACFPSKSGISGGNFVIDLIVDDTGFSKTTLATTSDGQVTLTLTNNGTKPHGFEMECTSVVSAYPNLPAVCPTVACFPASAVISPLAPGASQTINFETPTPDDLVYPFKSSEPDDSTIPGLNGGEWSLM